MHARSVSQGAMHGPATFYNNTHLDLQKVLQLAAAFKLMQFWTLANCKMKGMVFQW